MWRRIAFAIRGGPEGLPLIVDTANVTFVCRKVAWAVWTEQSFCYICKGVRRWVGAPGDWIAVDTAEKGELQFLVPG